MSKQLFKPVDQYEGEASVGESAFRFLRRGGRKKAVRIRNHLETWFESVPSEKKYGIERRLKSKDFDTFMSVSFELQVHNILKQIGCRVVIEPDILNCDKKVDFHAFCEDEDFYIEATVCGLSKEKLNYRDNEHQAVEKLRRELKNQNLLHSDLCLEANGDLKICVGSDFVESFRDLLSRFTPEEVREFYPHLRTWWHESYSLGFGSRRPVAKFRKSNWVVKGWLEPPAASNGIGQVVGPSRNIEFDLSEQLRRSLKRKAKHWKKLNIGDAIFLIAINACDLGCPEYDVRKALFGYTEPIEGTEVFSDYLSDVNGVIVFKNATLGREFSAPVRLYRNGEKIIPKCLDFLLQEQSLGELHGSDKLGESFLEFR